MAIASRPPLGRIIEDVKGSETLLGQYMLAAMIYLQPVVDERTILPDRYSRGLAVHVSTRYHPR